MTTAKAADQPILAALEKVGWPRDKVLVRLGVLDASPSRLENLLRETVTSDHLERLFSEGAQELGQIKVKKKG